MEVNNRGKYPKSYTITIEVTLEDDPRCSLGKKEGGEYRNATYTFTHNLPPELSYEQRKSIIKAMLEDMFP
jgi:hypothetical protein